MTTRHDAPDPVTTEKVQAEESDSWRSYQEIDTPHWDFPRTEGDDVIHWGLSPLRP